MKNFIPLILAVVLGLAAVLAVGRLLSAQRHAQEDTITVVAAARDIQQGQEITQDIIRPKEIPVSALPAQAIAWTRGEMIVGQKALRPVTVNDYVLLSDVGFSRSLANVVGEGEWAVSLTLPRSGLGRLVQPGDEVAVIGNFKVEVLERTTDLAAPEVVTTKEATLVLFPRVRVLDVTSAQGAGGGGSDIILALPPQQAQVLIAAQRRADITLALRRPNDDSSLNRMDAGMVDEETFRELLQGLNSVAVPQVPDRRGAPVQ